MQDDVVFNADRSGVNPRHVALIAGGFFVLVQLLFLEGWQARLGFAVFFALFLLVGFRLSGWSARTWPQEITLSRSGIRCGNMLAQHGVAEVPWAEVQHMDLFHTDPRLPPHLRIGLRPGAFRDRLKKTRLQRLSMGLDVNEPVAVDAPPQEVLETARRFWRQAVDGQR